MISHKEDIPNPNLDSLFEPDDYLYFYEESLSAERTQKEVEFLIKELQITKNMKILDLACGHGRHANMLAELGYDVTGIDYSPGFLDIARKEANQAGVNIRYIQGDMRNIKFVEEFDRVFLLFTSFGYFNDDENNKVIKNICYALKPGGLFFFDTLNRDCLMKKFVPYIVTEIGQDLMIDRNSFDFVTGRWHNNRIVIRDGIRKDKPFSVRLYNISEIQEILLKANMQLTQTFGGWDGYALNHNSRRMLIVAKKI